MIYQFFASHNHHIFFMIRFGKGDVFVWKRMEIDDRTVILRTNSGDYVME